MSEQQQEYSTSPAIVVEKKIGHWRRIGCLLILSVWLIVMLIPLFMFILAIQEDITLAHRAHVPDSYAHPWLQVKLISELDYRGINITRSVLHEEDEYLCIHTIVSYLLWEGEGEPASYCECYGHSSSDSEWGFIGGYDGDCQGIEGVSG